MFKNLTVSPLEAVLQLLSGILRPYFDNFCDDCNSFPEGGICRNQKQGHVVRLAQVWLLFCPVAKLDVSVDLVQYVGPRQNICSVGC